MIRLPSLPSWAVILLIMCSSPPSYWRCDAARHSFATKNDPRHWIGPLGPPFGFLKNGVYNLMVSEFSLEENHKVINDPKRFKEVGFLLKRFDSESHFFRYYESVLANTTYSCIFAPNSDKSDRELDAESVPFAYDDDDLRHVNTGEPQDPSGQGIPLSMRPVLSAAPSEKGYVASDTYTFKAGEEGLYFLMYQVCDKLGNASRIRSTFFLDFHFYNVDSHGMVSYLSAGESALPSVYFFFFFSFGLCTVLWMWNIHSIQTGRGSVFADSGHKPVVFAIHQFISLLLILKTCTVLMESLRYHYIRVSGHAELWSVLYYIFAFLKGTFMFTVILLIGSGWSFVKSYLTQREKTIILAVLVLQVLDNVALLVLSQRTQGERSFSSWNAIMHLIDILCCCAILLPLVWQVNELEKSLEHHEEARLEGNDEGQPLALVNDDGNHHNHQHNDDPGPLEEAEKNQILSKLRLFRSFYLLVVAYIYLTRVVVYLFTNALDYRHLWIQHVLVELVTLTFFVIIGLKFRPMEANPYFSVYQQRVEAAAESEERGVELQPTIMDRARDAKFS